MNRNQIYKHIKVRWPGEKRGPLESSQEALESSSDRYLVGPTSDCTCKCSTRDWRTIAWYPADSNGPSSIYCKQRIVCNYRPA